MTLNVDLDVPSICDEFHICIFREKKSQKNSQRAERTNQPTSRQDRNTQVGKREKRFETKFMTDQMPYFV